jgi:hypothetical protein
LRNVVYPLTTAAGWVEMPCGGTANYAWTFTHKQSSFTATLALDASDKARGLVVRFLDNFATPMSFRYHGKLIFSLLLRKNIRYPITLASPARLGSRFRLLTLTARRVSST